MFDLYFLFFLNIAITLVAILLIVYKSSNIKELHKTVNEQLSQAKYSQSTISDNIKLTQNNINTTLELHRNSIDHNFSKLLQRVDDQLYKISSNVEHKLSNGFDKTTETFGDIVKRLALIDHAQKKITDLSTQMVSLQNILDNKTARGAFGEIQLENIVKNMIPENNYKMQYTLSNKHRVDCMLFLPKPTNNLCIDAKFPLENFKRIQQETLPEAKTKLYKAFKTDLKKHIIDISSKYIVPGETANGAILFLPAEQIFAEIHTNMLDLVELAQKHKVWLCSPTTMMAVVTTVCASIRDHATEKHFNSIKSQLDHLSKDFKNLEKYIEKVGRHINLANNDVIDLTRSAQKITNRFYEIEAVE